MHHSIWSKTVSISLSFLIAGAPTSYAQSSSNQPSSIKSCVPSGLCRDHEGRRVSLNALQRQQLERHKGVKILGCSDRPLNLQIHPDEIDCIRTLFGITDSSSQDRIEAILGIASRSNGYANAQVNLAAKDLLSGEIKDAWDRSQEQVTLSRDVSMERDYGKFGSWDISDNYIAFKVAVGDLIAFECGAAATVSLSILPAAFESQPSLMIRTENGDKPWLDGVFTLTDSRHKVDISTMDDINDHIASSPLVLAYASKDMVRGGSVPLHGASEAIRLLAEKCISTGTYVVPGQSLSERYDIPQILGISPDEFLELSRYYGPIDCDPREQVLESVCGSEIGRSANLAYARSVNRVVELLDANGRNYLLREHPQLFDITYDLFPPCSDDAECAADVLKRYTALWDEIEITPVPLENGLPRVEIILSAGEPSRIVPMRASVVPTGLDLGEAFYEAERRIHARAELTQTIYKAPGFWNQFSNAALMKRIFEGNGVLGQPTIPLATPELSFDRLDFALVVISWARSFERHCNALLPHGASEWTKTVYTTIDGLTTEQTDRIRVHPNFEEAVRAYNEHSDSAGGKIARANTEISQMTDFMDRLDRGANPFSAVLEQGTRIMSPSSDIDILISDHGCDTPVTLQFRENLSRIATGQMTLQEAGIGIKGFEVATDPAPTP